MATGLIAFDRLAAHGPATIRAVETLIARHPDHARFDSELAALEGAARERGLFELIAGWKISAGRGWAKPIMPLA